MAMRYNLPDTVTVVSLQGRILTSCRNALAARRFALVYARTHGIDSLDAFLFLDNVPNGPDYREA